MGVLWFVGRQLQTRQSVSGTEANASPIRHMAYAGAGMVERLEGRMLLSAAPASPRVVPAVATSASATPAITVNPAVASYVQAVSSNPAGDITTPGQNAKTFEITYYSPDGIDTTTLGLANLTVSGPNGALNVVAWTIVSQTTDNVLVQYTFQKPGDTVFTPLDNGTYYVSTTATVKDLNTPADVEPVRSPIDFFLVNIPDTTPPVATKFTGPTANGMAIQVIGGDQLQFSIEYSDLYSTIDVSTVATDNVTVTSSNGTNIPVVSAVVNPPSTNGTPRTVTYTCQFPSLITAADNGTYYVSITNTLHDVAGLAIVPVVGVGQFTIDVADVSSPTSVNFSPPTVNTGDTSDTFTVTYNDNVNIDINSLASDNVYIQGPHGQAQYATFVSASPTTDSTSVVATYEFTAPNSTVFTAADNGPYTFNLLSSVTDTSGNLIPAQKLGTFNLALNPADIARTEIGEFGNINGKNVSLHFRGVPNGVVGTFKLTGGVGEVYLETANSLVDLYIADSGGGVKLTVTSNASNPIQLGNVLINGTLLNGALNTSELHGTFFATGAIQQLTLSNIFGSVVAAGQIGTINVLHGITGGEILSGTNLGSDGQFGGTGGAADTYGAGSIAAVKVNGSIASAFVGAGIVPGPNGQFGSASDTVLGGSSSLIGYLQAKSIDPSSKFEAGAFGKAKSGNKFLNLSTDGQFIVPPAAT